MANYLQEQSEGQNRQQGVKNFLKALTNMGDLAANETRLKTQLLANQLEKKQNLLYKMQEQDVERKNKLNFIQDLQKKMQGGQPGEFGDINAIQMQVGSGGEPTLKYPSARDKEFAIKQGWARIEAKQAKKMTLSPAETKFMETYPKSMLGGGNLRKVIEDKILSGTATKDEINRYNLLRGKSSEDLFSDNSIPDTLTNPNPNQSALPSGVTEEDITHTLKLHPEITRDDLIAQLSSK